MLKNIKSKYIIKTFFSLLGENKKLKIVKYNKCLQDKIEINLINYKVFSGRYIQKGDKQIIKKYNLIKDKLIFEGEYLKGERNGKGKEYHDNGFILFEGEFKSGKRN